MRWINSLLPLNYRSIDSATVANTRVGALQTFKPGCHVLLSGALQMGTFLPIQ